MIPREKMMPLWVLTPAVAANMAASALTPMGRMAGNSSDGEPSRDQPVSAISTR